MPSRVSGGIIKSLYSHSTYHSNNDYSTLMVTKTTKQYEDTCIRLLKSSNKLIMSLHNSITVNSLSKPTFNKFLIQNHIQILYMNIKESYHSNMSNKSKFFNNNVKYHIYSIDNTTNKMSLCNEGLNILSIYYNNHKNDNNHNLIKYFYNYYSNITTIVDNNRCLLNENNKNYNINEVTAVLCRLLHSNCFDKIEGENNNINFNSLSNLNTNVNVFKKDYYNCDNINLNELYIVYNLDLYLFKKLEILKNKEYYYNSYNQIIDNDNNTIINIENELKISKEYKSMIINTIVNVLRKSINNNNNCSINNIANMLIDVQYYLTNFAVKYQPIPIHQLLTIDNIISNNINKYLYNEALYYDNNDNNRLIRWLFEDIIVKSFFIKHIGWPNYYQLKFNSFINLDKNNDKNDTINKYDKLFKILFTIINSNNNQIPFNINSEFQLYLLSPLVSVMNNNQLNNQLGILINNYAIALNSMESYNLSLVTMVAAFVVDTTANRLRQIGTALQFLSEYKDIGYIIIIEAIYYEQLEINNNNTYIPLITLNHTNNTTNTNNTRYNIIFYCNEYGNAWWPKWGPNSINNTNNKYIKKIIYNL
jgi:hypothetical protein